MKSVKTSLVVFFLAAVFSSVAEYQVELTFDNGAVRSVDNLVIESGKVILAQENLQVPFSQIRSANFTFDQPLSADACEVFLKRGAYREMIDKLNSFLMPVSQALPIPGNLDLYVQYKMRACFWAKNYADASAAARLLQDKNSSYAPLAALYQVLILLEQDASAETVAQALSKISDPRQISAPIAEFIAGRMAMDKRAYDVALQHFANILVFHGRDPEWAPAAAFYEGVVYKRTGYLESASNIADELRIAYPDADWGRRADELK